jgi:hypothetical protein
MPLPALLAAFGTAATGAGAAATGIGSLISAFRGGGASTTGGADLASLYPELAYGQLPITVEQQKFGYNMQPVLQMQGLQNQILGQTAYNQYQNSLNKDQTAAGMLAGIASQYANNAVDLLTKGKQAQMGMEVLGAENASKIAQTYAAAAGTLQNQILTGESGMLTPTAQATAQAGLAAQTGKNEMARKIGETNLGIRAAQEQTRNALVQQRAATEGQLAMKRLGAGLALGAQRAFA